MRWHDLVLTGETSTFSYDVIEFPKALADVQTPGFILCLSSASTLILTLLISLLLFFACTRHVEALALAPVLKA